MLIPLTELVLSYGVKPGPTLHVGAHLGEEAAMYRSHNFRPVTWVEANPELIPALKQRVREQGGGRVICAALGSAEGEGVLHVASNGQSSSLLPLGTHATEHPDVTYVGEKSVKITTLDKLLTDGAVERASYVSMDVQGVELDVLKGGTAFLSSVNFLYLEVNTENVYDGCAQLPELESWLSERGFHRQVLKLTNHGWGDALYGRS